MIKSYILMCFDRGKESYRCNDEVEVKTQSECIADNFGHIKEVYVLATAIDQAVISDSIEKWAGRAHVVRAGCLPLILRSEPRDIGDVTTCWLGRKERE